MIASNVSLEVKVAFLSDPSHYDERPSRIDAVETHMSWVFLTDQFAYKLKKPMLTDFLDFHSLQARRLYCEEEIRLNRRLAPEVYLRVSALTQSRGQLTLDAPGEPVEWLVKMVRLPRELMLDFLLYKGQVTATDIWRFMHVLLAFYRRAPSEALAPNSYHNRQVRDIHDNHAAIAVPAYELNTTQLEYVHARLQRFLPTHAAWSNDRVAQGRVIEAHGDLRPEHVCLTPTPVFIDCLEFNRDFRLLDPVHELAYLAMECDYLHAPFADAAIFQVYKEDLADAPPRPLIEFYKTERALLRAKLALWHLRDHEPSEHAKWTARAQRYLDLAVSYCDRLE